MPIAVNDQGVVVIERNGVWEKAPTARNDQGATVYHDGKEWKPVPAAQGPQDDSGYLNKVMRSVAQGATLGYADEVAAAADATIGPLVGRGSQVEGWSNRYNENLGTERARDKEFGKNSPVSNIGGQVVGGVLGTLSGARALGAAGALPKAAATVGGRVLQGAEVGAGTGALAGFGSGEGGFGERMEGAATGGAIGGVIGAAAPLVVEGVSRVGSRALDAVGLRNPEKGAQRQVMRAIERDQAAGGPGVAEIQQGINQNVGPRVTTRPETIPDVAGNNVQQLARTAARIPSKAQQAAVETVTNRNTAQPARIGEDITRLVSPKTDYYATVDELMQKRAAQAFPLYDEAFKKSAWSPRLQEFIDEPTFKEGIKRGVAMLRREAVAEGKPLNLHAMGVDLDDAGEIVLRDVPNMRILDAAKRGIDDILEKFRDPTTGRLHLTPEGRSIEMLRSSYLKVLDDLNPTYADARAAYAGPSVLKDAMAAGRNVLRPDAEITAKMVERMSPSEKEFFAAGVAKALRDKIENTSDGRNVLNSFFNKSAVRDKLEAAFPSKEAFAQFETLMKREANMWRVGQQMDPRTGSQTFALQQSAKDMMTDPPVGALANLARGNIGEAGLQGVQGLMRRAQGMNSATADNLADLYSTDPKVQMEFLARALAEGQRAQQQSAGRYENLLRAIAGSGAAAGSLTQ